MCEHTRGMVVINVAVILNHEYAFQHQLGMCTAGLAPPERRLTWNICVVSFNGFDCITVTATVIRMGCNLASHKQPPSLPAFCMQ